MLTTNTDKLIELLQLELGGNNSTLFAMNPIDGDLRQIEFGDTEIIMHTCRSFNLLSEKTKSPWAFFFIPGFHSTESVEARELKGRYDFFFSNHELPII